MAHRMRDMEVTLGALHSAILRHLVERGYAPRRAWLGERFGVSDAVMRDSLRRLAEYHGVVLHPHEEEVWVAHPFATAATPFVVRRGEQRWWGNCAWCSLGIAALLGGEGVVIETRLGGDGEVVRIEVEGGRVKQEEWWVHFPVPMRRAWENVVWTCSMMLVFESESAVDAWCERHGVARGSVEPIGRIYEMAQVWYGRHLNEDWRKWTVEEAGEIFRRFGLVGPVWELESDGGRF